MKNKKKCITKPSKLLTHLIDESPYFDGRFIYASTLGMMSEELGMPILDIVKELMCLDFCHEIGFGFDHEDVGFDEVTIFIDMSVISVKYEWVD
jgi:hypothetical protein